MSNDLVTIATFSQPIQAHLAKARLEAAGIVCIVADEHVVQANWLFSNAIGGVKLKVPTDYVAAARDILRPQPRLVVVADKDEVPDDAQDDMICPSCRSFDVYHHPLQHFIRAAAYIAWKLAFIPWAPRRWWLCKTCGYRWTDRDNHPSH